MLFSKPGLSPTKILVALAVTVASTTVASTPAMANPVCGLSQPGCVLPVQDVVAAPVVTTPAPVMIAEEPKGFPLILLLGAVAAGLALLLLLDDEEEDLPASP